LRPIWRDARVHYAVNCASIGCPNLIPFAFTGSNISQLLELAAYSYINHPHGVRIKDGNLIVSKIYACFSEDFGGTQESVILILGNMPNQGCWMPSVAVMPSTITNTTGASIALGHEGFWGFHGGGLYHTSGQSVRVNAEIV
jgi:hypothetical protein